MQDLFDLSGKVAIVTGTSRGLGQYFGRALAGAGADLVITSRNIESLAEFKKEIEDLGRKALPVQLDVLSQSDIENMVQVAIQEYGKIDILVNNAGLNIRSTSAEFSWEDWDTVLNTNLKQRRFVYLRLRYGGNCALYGQQRRCSADDPEPRCRVGQIRHNRQRTRSRLVQNRSKRRSLRKHRMAGLYQG